MEAGFYAASLYCRHLSGGPGSCSSRPPEVVNGDGAPASLLHASSYVRPRSRSSQTRLNLKDVLGEKSTVALFVLLCLKYFHLLGIMFPPQRPR